ncbi:MAG TPA: VWA domain-containing protein, partial [Ktedonobacterales bacterium]|nr:VWA domain-containing protein [Ktedonobacterales bacterium]
MADDPRRLNADLNASRDASLHAELSAGLESLADPSRAPDARATGDLLLARIVDFTHLLWEMGLDIGPGRVVEVVEGLPLVNLASRQELYYYLKTNLVTRHEYEATFDAAFAWFWRRADQRLTAPPPELEAAPHRRRSAAALPPDRQREDDAASARHPQPQARQRHPASRLRDARRKQNDEQRDDKQEEQQIGAFSAEEALRRKDFEEFTWDEMRQARELMARMRWRLSLRQTRRLRAARRGPTLDLRRTFRRSLRSGGEPVQLARRERRRKPRPLVILCDISGSMSLYSRLLLHFIHTVSNGREHVETFVFATRLTRITRQLARRDVDAAVQEVTKTVQDWSGGTRIGESLRAFNYRWARRTLGHGAVVLIISDGWDRGDTQLLTQEMARLQRNCHRLIWLNPLLGQQDYRPVTAGMRAALPYIDDFLPAHTLDSLVALGKLLESVDDTTRPARATHITP